MAELAFAIAWRVVVFFLVGLPIALIKHVAINHYGWDPYWVGRELGILSFIVSMALLWRWLPVRLTHSEDAKPPRPTLNGARP